MNARVELDWATGQMRVWFYERMGDGRIRVPHIADEWQDTTVPENAVAEPSLILPSDWLKALVEAGADALPPSGQMAEHLKDATQVRDRLAGAGRTQVGRPMNVPLTASPGETVTCHEDVIRDARRLACTSASVFCATYLPNHTAAEHATIEARYLHLLMPVVHDGSDEIHVDREHLAERLTPEAEIPELLWEMRR